MCNPLEKKPFAPYWSYFSCYFFVSSFLGVPGNGVPHNFPYLDYLDVDDCLLLPFFNHIPLWMAWFGRYEAKHMCIIPQRMCHYCANNGYKDYKTCVTVFFVGIMLSFLHHRI